MSQSSSSASSFVLVNNADGSTIDLTLPFTMESHSDASAASPHAESRTPFYADSEDGQGEWRWQPDTTKNYNSTDGIYFVIPWKREIGSDFYRARVPWKVGLAPNDNKSSAARDRELRKMLETLGKLDHITRDGLLDGIDTEAGRAMTWDTVKEHFFEVWPKEGEVGARLASEQEASKALQVSAKMSDRAPDEAEEPYMGSPAWWVVRRDTNERMAVFQVDKSVAEGGSWVAGW